MLLQSGLMAQTVRFKNETTRKMDKVLLYDLQDWSVEEVPYSDKLKLPRGKELFVVVEDEYYTPFVIGSPQKKHTLTQEMIFGEACVYMEDGNTVEVFFEVKNESDYTMLYLLGRPFKREGGFSDCLEEIEGRQIKPGESKRISFYYNRTIFELPEHRYLDIKLIGYNQQGEVKEFIYEGVDVESSGFTIR